MSLPKLIIALGAEFDNKGFKKADTAIVKMAKSARNLGAALGIAYATKQVVAYAKAAAVAAAADQRAQMLLSAQLKNLGMLYANASSEDFIKNLESQSAIIDDVLRPSYSQLLRVTGSIASTEKIMASAFDIASGAGLGYAQTIDILSQAYVGNLKGLKQLNTGLTNAELAALSFEDLLALLNKQFAGAGATAVAGYAGQMDKLNIATGNASETIGGALLDAFKRLAGGGDIDKATKQIDAFAAATALLIGSLSGGQSISSLVQRYFQGELDLNMGHPSMKAPKLDTSLTDKAAEDRARKEAALAAKTAKAKAALEKKLENERKAAAAAAAKAKLNADKLNEASAYFDMNRISIAAALKATYDTETTLRLLAMQAIANDNGELALEYERRLDAVRKTNYANQLAGITTITNASLAGLNTVLITELNNINASEMAEASKEAARQAAFSKYNDALNKSGGLAAMITYEQKTQDQLAAIAKLAALSGYGAALDTLNKIIRSIELNTIEIVRTAQEKADKAKMDALNDYIALLLKARAAALGAVPSVGGNPTVVPKLIPGVDYNPGQNKDRNYDLKNPPVLGPPPNLSPTMIPGVTYNPSQNADRNYDITINAGVIANQDELNLILQTAIQNMNRNGYDLSVAGAI